jgi:hypothetical protein
MLAERQVVVHCEDPFYAICMFQKKKMGRHTPTVTNGFGMTTSCVRESQIDLLLPIDLCCCI